MRISDFSDISTRGVEVPNVKACMRIAQSSFGLPLTPQGCLPIKVSRVLTDQNAKWSITRQSNLCDKKCKNIAVFLDMGCVSAVTAVKQLKAGCLISHTRHAYAVKLRHASKLPWARSEAPPSPAKYHSNHAEHSTASLSQDEPGRGPS